MIRKAIAAKARPRLPAQKAGYHHTDLRRALLDAAIVHLRNGDVTALTMQTLARAAGVSPGAPYHHFPDKVAVVAALATEGYEIWLERAKRSVAQATTPRERLIALARGWLRFAAAFPSHYRVMFLRDIEDRARYATLHETSGAGLQLLVEVVAEVWPDLTPSGAMAQAVATWSTLHGFASLQNAGVLVNIPRLPSVATLEAAAIALLLPAP